MSCYATSLYTFCSLISLHLTLGHIILRYPMSFLQYVPFDFDVVLCNFTLFRLNEFQSRCPSNHLSLPVSYNVVWFPGYEFPARFQGAGISWKSWSVEMRRPSFLHTITSCLGFHLWDPFSRLGPMSGCWDIGFQHISLQILILFPN